MFPNGRFLVLVVTLSCLPNLVGCFKVGTLLKVNPDGSGRLIESLDMNEQTLNQMQAMMADFALGMGAQAKPKVDMFSSDSFKVKASEYGPGVKLLGVKKTKENGRFKVVAEYAVTDISKVRLSSNTQQQMPGPGRAGPGASLNKPGKTFKLSLRKLPRGLSELTIKLPPPEPGSRKQQKPKAADAGSRPPEQNPPPQMLEMLKDLEMTLAVECGKEIVETNATNVEGNRVTLVHFAFGELLKHPEKLKELQQLGPKARDLEAVKPLVKGLKGIQFEWEPVVHVKFR